MIHHTFGHYTCTSVICNTCGHASRSYVSECSLMVNMKEQGEQDLEGLLHVSGATPESVSGSERGGKV